MKSRIQQPEKALKQRDSGSVAEVGQMNPEQVTAEVTWSGSRRQQLNNRCMYVSIKIQVPERYTEKGQASA